MSFPRRLLTQALAGKIQRLDEAGVRAVDHVVVENELMRQWVVQQNQGAVSLIPPGIDTSEFRPSGPWNPQGPIVAVGRLGEARKGWSRLFHSYGELIARRPDAPSLILAGRGDLSSADQASLHSARIQDRVDVRRDLTSDELIALLQQASVFIQTSYEEGLGLAGLEAMACGVPMVATSTAGTREYLRSGVNGVLVARDDRLVQAMSEAVEAVLTGAGGDMAAAARSTVEEVYSSGRCLSGFVSIYQGLVPSAD